MTDPEHPTFLPPGHPSAPTVEQPVARAPIWQQPDTPPTAPGGAYGLGGHLTPPPIPPAPGGWRQEVPSTPGRRRELGGSGLLLGLVVGAVVSALVATGLVMAFDHDPAPSRATSGPTATIPAGAAMDVRDVLDHVEQSVVSIEVNGRDSGGLFGAGRAW